MIVTCSYDDEKPWYGATFSALSLI